MKTKLTLLKNALLVGCAMFALTSCSDDDDATRYTTDEVQGTFRGTMSIRAKGDLDPLDQPSVDFNDVLVKVEALSATQLKYSCAQAAASATVFGFTVEATVDFASNGDDIAYYTSTNGKFVVDSLKDGNTHTYTTYADCTTLAQPSRLGSILEMDHTNGGRLVYRAWDREEEEPAE